MSSVEAAFEQNARKFADVAEKVEKATAAKRAERQEERRAFKEELRRDAKQGTTDKLLAGDLAQDSDDPRDFVLTQERIDHIRAEITMKTLLKAYEKDDWSVAGTIQYLWFPENDIRKMEVREGNPPADQDRPKHMQRMQLVMDHKAAPAELHHLMQATAKKMRDIHKKQLQGGNKIRRALQENHRLGVALRNKLGVVRG